MIPNDDIFQCKWYDSKDEICFKYDEEKPVNCNGSAFNCDLEAETSVETKALFPIEPDGKDYRDDVKLGIL